MHKDFLWGAAASSHQVEGGNYNDWTEWERVTAEARAKQGKLKNWPDFIAKAVDGPSPLQKEHYISGRACDHYHRFKEDFDIAKSLGHNAHRLSIEWSRIEPEEGEFNEKAVAHYKEVVQALRDRGLEPFVTLWHWTLPLWLAKKGGVLNKKFPDYFEQYVGKITEALGNDVNFWITVNEPEIYSLDSYLKGARPPQKKNLFLFYASIARLIQAHRKAYRIIKKTAPSAHIGAAFDMTYFESAGGFINDFLKWAADGIWNFHFLNHIHKEVDFIGLNYYFHSRVNYGFNKNKNKETSDMGWEIYPKGIYYILKALAKYGLPIYVTENGIADAKDERRARFIKNHVSMMEAAIQEGTDVRGYFYWSLLDNFEWDKGFWPRFGLIEVDYKTMKRTIRPSAWEYKKLIGIMNKEL